MVQNGLSSGGGEPVPDMVSVAIDNRFQEQTNSVISKQQSQEE